MPGEIGQDVDVDIVLPTATITLDATPPDLGDPGSGARNGIWLESGAAITNNATSMVDSCCDNNGKAYRRKTQSRDRPQTTNITVR